MLVSRGHTRHGTSHAQIGDLCHHLRVQENVSGRQVAVDDGRRSLVQVGQAARHVVQHGALENRGEEGGAGRGRCVGSEQVVKTRQQSLYDEVGSHEPGKKATPRNGTTFGWRTVLISWHSLTNSATALGSSLGELSSPSCRKAKSVLAAAPTGKATSSTLPYAPPPILVPVSWTSERTNGLSSGWSRRKSSSIIAIVVRLRSFRNVASNVNPACCVEVREL